MSVEKKQKGEFKFSSILCWVAPTSAAESIDLGMKPEKKAGLSRDPSFTIVGGLNEDDTLQLVMQPSRNGPKNAMEVEPLDPKKLLQEASQSLNPLSDETKFSLFESQHPNFSIERKMQIYAQLDKKRENENGLNEQILKDIEKGEYVHYEINNPLVFDRS